MFNCDGCGARIGDYDQPVRGPRGQMLCKEGCGSSFALSDEVVGIVAELRNKRTRFEEASHAVDMIRLGRGVGNKKQFYNIADDVLARLSVDLEAAISGLIADERAFGSDPFDGTKIGA